MATSVTTKLAERDGKEFAKDAVQNFLDVKISISGTCLLPMESDVGDIYMYQLSSTNVGRHICSYVHN